MEEKSAGMKRSVTSAYAHVRALEILAELTDGERLDRGDCMPFEGNPNEWVGCAIDDGALWASVSFTRGHEIYQFVVSEDDFEGYIEFLEDVES